MNAIITGATKGIGRAISIKLAENGFNLALCARNADDLNALAAKLCQYHVKVFTFVADLSDKSQTLNFCRQAFLSFDQIDVLVNNAGAFIPQNILDEKDSDFEYQMAVNVSAVYFISKFFGRIMRNQQLGHIFNICSVASKAAVQNAGSYSVTKAALLSLNDVLRTELALHQVKVTAVLPGSTLTASWEGTSISKEKFVQPGDIAEMINAVLKMSKGANVDELTIKPLNFI